MGFIYQNFLTKDLGIVISYGKGLIPQLKISSL